VAFSKLIFGMDPSNNTFIYLYRKKVGGPDRAVEYEKLLVEWIEEKYYQIQVLIYQYCTVHAGAV
jgi:hypothetical protein